MEDLPILRQYLKFKNSNSKIWKPRYCVLFSDKLIIRKSSEDEEIEHEFPINSDTETVIHPNELIIKSPTGHMITLGSDDGNAILNWAQNVRNLTLVSTNITMDDFDIISVIGRGLYGKVSLCRKKDTKEIYAIKAVRKKRLVMSDKVHTIFTERNVLVNSRHPFIVNLCFAFQTDSKVYLGLEYAPGGELFFQLQQRAALPLEEVKFYIAEVALALNYLHNKGIIYRDLKPENVLLDNDGHVKLTDFGLSKILEAGNTATTFCGTCEYLAPEIIAKMPYSFAVDWWALGILTFELLYGRTPFTGENNAKLFHEIRFSRPSWPRTASMETIDFIAMLIEKDPAKRATFEQIKSHPWYDGWNFEDILMKRVRPKHVPVQGSTQEPINFDVTFTMEDPMDSLVTPSSIATYDQFAGFSFVQGENDGMNPTSFDELGEIPPL